MKQGVQLQQVGQGKESLGCHQFLNEEQVNLLFSKCALYTGSRTSYRWFELLGSGQGCRSRCWYIAHALVLWLVLHTVLITILFLLILCRTRWGVWSIWTFLHFLNRLKHLHGRDKENDPR